MAGREVHKNAGIRLDVEPSWSSRAASDGIVHSDTAREATSPAGISGVFTGMLRDMEGMERRISLMLKRVERGGTLSPGQMVALQKLVLTQSRLVELTSRLVEMMHHSVEKVQQSVR